MLLRFKQLLVWVHRWTALVLGALLVVVSTSGALVVYAPELLRTGNAELFRHTPCERRQAPSVDDESKSIRTESLTATNPMR